MTSARASWGREREMIDLKSSSAIDIVGSYISQGKFRQLFKPSPTPGFIAAMHIHSSILITIAFCTVTVLAGTVKVQPRGKNIAVQNIVVFGDSFSDNGMCIAISWSITF